jgi:hypothetical protein
MDDGQPVTDKILRRWLTESKRRAQLPLSPGALHVLRHTFCSHLAMRAAPAKDMHLSPAARVSAIGLLNGREGAEESPAFGEMLETGPRRA